MLYARRSCTSWRWLSHARARAYSTATSEPFKVLFFGRDEFSCVVMQQLLQAKVNVWQDIQVVTQPDMKIGRRVHCLAPLKLLAQEAGLQVHTIPQERKAFRSWEAPSPFVDYVYSDPGRPPPSNHLFVTASFGRILSRSLLGRVQPSRRLNVHPSLLPEYRGPSPLQYTLIDQVKETGVCVIEMLEKNKRNDIDSGSIFASEKMRVPEDANFASLRDALALRGGNLLVSVMRAMMVNKDIRRPQAGHAQRLQVDFRKQTAAEIAALHRGIAHQIHEVTEVPAPLVGGPDASCWSGVLHKPMKTFFVRCADDSFIAVQKVKQQDRSLMSAKDWWSGLPAQLRPLEFLPWNASG
ncbi:Formyltransferase [Epithele typhae]|uniref:Formyltransferase n=1 Tax=Epithele typhae TaxID=378194 RepID=UPI002007CDE1|nr:Formyltransferase [Epithele typhae]KAH9917648.1 Formyltransferase [Epithele typhae]